MNLFPPLQTFHQTRPDFLIIISVREKKETIKAY